MVPESAFTVTRCKALPKQGVMGEWVLTIPGTALFSALTALL